MDCERADSLLHHYFLGLLSTELGESLELHLDACGECGARLSTYGDTIAQMARSMPQHQAPERIRQSLFTRIDGKYDGPYSEPYSHVWRFAAFWTAIRTTSVSRKRATGMLLAMSLILGVWINYAQKVESPGAGNESPEVANLTGRDSRSESRLLETPGAMETATAIAELVVAQPPGAYDGLGVTPPPGITVSMLQGTVGATGPRGVLIASEGRAMLLALDLPPLPSYQVYQIWLVKSDSVVNAGLLTVDATGYGQTIIIPYFSFAEYDGIGITIEPASGSPDPTGARVLQGDL